jgi:two-component system, NtrC family, sensor kinase
LAPRPKHTPEGVYTYVSPACRLLLGYEPEELAGRSAYTFFHPGDLEHISTTDSAVLQRPDVYTVSYRIRRKDGSCTWFETTSRMVREAQTDEMRGVMVNSGDITERKRAEEALAQVLRARTEFMADASPCSPAIISVTRLRVTLTKPRLVYKL